MLEQEKKYFADEQSGFGLNSDDSAFAIPLNSYVNCENLRSGSTDKGVTGTMESVASNLQVSVDAQTDTIELGSYADSPNNRIIYFLYDTLNTNSNKIVAYYRSTGNTYVVTFDGQVTGNLNFNKNYPIQSWMEGNLLFWTDNYTDPKCINVDAAIKLNYPSFVTDVAPYTSPIAQSVITLIRYAPQRPPSLTFQTIPSRQNFLRDFAGEFAYRNNFRDGQTSVFGTPSVMVNYRFGTNPSQTNYDNSNRITVTLQWQNGFDIEQDVQRFELAVRYDNQPDYFVLKVWDKSNAADLAEINAYNAGGALTYFFYNDKTGSPAGTLVSAKPFDTVPNLSGTGGLGLDRNFLGNNTIGYDTPATTSLRGSVSLSGGIQEGSQIFKSWSTYQLGIRFRDKYKRACGVVTDAVQSIVTIPDRGDYNNATSFYNLLSATLSNTNALAEIPDWAYYYDILITKNLRTRFFAEWAMRSGDVQYVIKNVNGTYTYQNTYVGGLFGLAFKTSNLTLNGMGVKFEQGDFVRVYLSGLSTAPFSLAVVAQDADYIICNPIDIGTTTSLVDLILVEYYTPYISSGNEFFYTVGGVGVVNNPTTSIRQYGTTGFNITGDVTFGYRFFYSPSIYGYWSESMSPNDNLWKNWFGIYGEENIVTSLGRVVKETSVKWSNTIIEGSNTNGLSTFDAENEKLLPLSMGTLRKLQPTSKVQEQGNIMLAIAEQQTASLYLGEVQTYGSDQRPASVNTVQNVIGTVNILKGDYGTINPESVTEYRGMVFWIDVNNGRIIQYSVNGLFPISNYKMTRFWNLWCKQYKSMTSAQIEALGGRPFVFMAVDSVHNELLISIPKLSSVPPKGYLPDYPSTIYPFDIYDLQEKVIVYSLDANPNHWQGAYTFYTEGFVTMNNDLYSFKNGQLWIHNQTTNYCNFYGVQYKSKIMPISNLIPTVPKSYNNISLEVNICPTFVYAYNDYPVQQSTDLVDFDFENREGIWYANFYRNKLIPTATGFVTTGLLTGEKMRNVAMYILIEFTVGTNPIELKFLNIGFEPSLGHENWMKK